MNIDLPTLANIAEVLGALTIVGGAGFAVVQIREFRAQRRQDVAIEVLRSFQNPDFVRAANLIRTLPDGLSAKDLRDRGSEYDDAALLIGLTFETVALLVHQELASFSLVREATGGLSVVCHRKLSGWVRDIRIEQSQPSWAEWFQWISEQMERESESKEANPAHLRHADWRPRARG